MICLINVLWHYSKEDNLFWAGRGVGAKKGFSQDNNFVWPQSILGLLDRGDSEGEEQVDRLGGIQDDDGNGREKALKWEKLTSSVKDFGCYAKKFGSEPVPTSELVDFYEVEQVIVEHDHSRKMTNRHLGGFVQLLITHSEWLVKETLLWLWETVVW